MSNYLAIATVTAALRQILQEGIQNDIQEAVVTTVRPDSLGAVNQTAGINIYLYHATPNPAWRNADLRTNRPKGSLTKHGQAALDLHYLLTFYGNEQELIPQRLMGSTIKILVDKPILTQDIIQKTLDSNTSNALSFLANSTLGDQVDLVKFIPTSITTDELSRIWSIFFQVPYSLSFAYQGTAVLIEGDKPGKVTFPVRRPQFNISSARPIIDKVEQINDADFNKSEPRIQAGEPITCCSSLIIRGRQLKARGQQSLGHHQQSNEITQVHIGKAKLTPQVIADNQVKIQLASLALEERSGLRAGVQGIQIVRVTTEQIFLEGKPPYQTTYRVESNAIPLVLCPRILGDSAGISLQTVENEGAIQTNALVQVDVRIAPEQRVFLLLNRLSGEHDPEEDEKTYIIAALPRSETADTIAFPVDDVVAGTYLVRIQVDGAESPFNEEQLEPRVVIPNQEE
ncbi:MAG: DUF4255 domain-containing protein [Leptolyngbyaceae cyanobacterium bins.302]|nr:DUF4255 domain-containing protein [Leptolyngbyaceae cyanobacterium bins.302]